jgi:hypothetical protein
MLYKEIEGSYFFLKNGSWVHEAHMDWLASLI